MRAKHPDDSTIVTSFAPLPHVPYDSLWSLQYKYRSGGPTAARPSVCSHWWSQKEWHYAYRSVVMWFENSCHCWVSKTAHAPCCIIFEDPSSNAQLQVVHWDDMPRQPSLAIVALLLALPVAILVRLGGTLLLTDNGHAHCMIQTPISRCPESNDRVELPQTASRNI
jgi:hypothetical protein